MRDAAGVGVVVLGGCKNCTGGGGVVLDDQKLLHSEPQIYLILNLFSLLKPLNFNVIKSCGS